MQKQQDIIIFNLLFCIKERKFILILLLFRCIIVSKQLRDVLYIHLIILFHQCLMSLNQHLKNMVLFPYHNIKGNEAIKAYIINIAYRIHRNILIILPRIYNVIYSLCKWQSSPTKAWDLSQVCAERGGFRVNLTFTYLTFIEG